MNDPDSVLRFTNKREEKYMAETTSRIVPPEDVLPEYFLLRVNQFNDVAKTPIEEWMAYLKSGVIKDDTRTPGLQAAREKLNYMRMTAEERHAYDDYMVSVHAARDVYQTAIAEARAEERAANEIKLRNIAKSLKSNSVPVDVISTSTGLSVDEIEKL
jgi:hypothetical protein